MTHLSASIYFFALLLGINMQLIFSAQYNGSSSFLTVIFSDYDKAVRPNFKVRPTEVLSDLYVDSFGNIEETEMEFRVYGYFQQSWRDNRLANKLNHSIILKGGDINHLWLPDPFCYNARQTNLMSPNTEVPNKLSIDVQGNVFYTRSVEFLASCDMDLHLFPFDTQECSLKFGSYAYSTDHIVYSWKKPGIVLASTEMAQFRYQKAVLSSDIETYYSGDFSVITITFVFKRRIGFYLIQVYFPDILVVALSWIVFWMEKEDMGNRMALGITTILTIMFLLGSINSTLPKVSYPKALDWYLLVSFTFTFLSLVECMVVFVIWLSDEMRNANKNGRFRTVPASSTIKETQVHSIHDDCSVPARGRDMEMCQLMSPTESLNERRSVTKLQTVITNHAPQKRAKKGRSMEEIAAFIDKLSRVLFPLIFGLFNIVYWSYYTTSK